MRSRTMDFIGRQRRLIGIAPLIPVMIAVGRPADAQQSEQPAQQPGLPAQQPEQHDQPSVEQLERRMTALEQELEREKETKPPPTASAAPETPKKTVLAESANAGQDFQGRVPAAPTYDLLREAETKIEGLEK